SCSSSARTLDAANASKPASKRRLERFVFITILCSGEKGWFGVHSDAPGWAGGVGEEPVGLFVAHELGFRRIPLERALQDQGNAADKDRVDGLGGGFGIADRQPPAADALEKVPRMAVCVVNPGVSGTQRLCEDARRVRNDAVAVHRDAAFGPHEAGAAIVAHWFAWGAVGVDLDAVRVTVLAARICRTLAFGLIRTLDRRVRVGVDGQLDDVVVVRAPVHVADETSGKGM